MEDYDEVFFRKLKGLLLRNIKGEDVYSEIADMLGYDSDRVSLPKILERYRANYGYKEFPSSLYDTITDIHSLRLCELKRIKDKLYGSYACIHGEKIDTTKKENIAELECEISRSNPDSWHIYTRKNDFEWFFKYQSMLSLPFLKKARRIYYYGNPTWVLICFPEDVIGLFQR